MQEHASEEGSSPYLIALSLQLGFLPELVLLHLTGNVLGEHV